MEFRYEYAGQTSVVQVEAAEGAYIVSVAGRTYRVKASAIRAGEVDLELDGGRRCRAWVAADGPSRWVALETGEGGGQVFVLNVPDTGPRLRHGKAAGHEALEAQMPGVVRRVLVAAGDSVARGQALLLLEAMKMEIRVTAPLTGVVQRIAVVEGQAVERGQALVEVASLAEAPE